MKVKLPYPVKILGIRFVIKREIGFEFTNLMIFNYRENTNVTDSATMSKYVEDHGNSGATGEMLFGAAQAYCMIHKVRENFKKEELLQAIMLAPTETYEKILKTLNESLTGLDKSKSKGEVKKKMKL